MQVEDDDTVEPTLPCSDIGDDACPFTVGNIGNEIAIEPVRRYTQAMMTVGRDRVPTRTDRLDPVDPHQPANPVLADIIGHLE